MAALTRMEGRCSVLSLEERVIDLETEQPVSLGELLANGRDDRMVAATRDWTPSEEDDRWSW